MGKVCVGVCMDASALCMSAEKNSGDIQLLEEVQSREP